MSLFADLGISQTGMGQHDRWIVQYFVFDVDFTCRGGLLQEASGRGLKLEFEVAIDPLH